MAKETRGIGSFKVGAHHNLGMAANASHLVKGFEIPEMKSVIEMNRLFIGDLFFHEFLGVASFPETARVLDLRIWPGAVFLGHILNHRIERLDFGPNRGFGFGRVVTRHAGHVVVFGVLPGIIIRHHIVAAFAERRAGRIIERA
jgi:hypothetical protein